MKKNKTLIIAEAGVNHNGSFKIAKKLIDVASRAGADIVKFQTFKTDSFLIKKTPKANYQKKSSMKNQTQNQMLEKLELNYNDHIKLINYCKKKKIEFLSTPFDIDSIKLLIKLNLKRIKIPSGEINNLPYLKYISRFKGQVLLSTGMSNLNEVRDAINSLLNFGINKDNLVIMHCNSAYPTPFKDVNLNAMLTLKKNFNTKIGYSDHTLGIEVPIAAVSLGANVIEKHFTIDREAVGPDHKASLLPEELTAMVKAIRNIETSLGSKKKIVSKSELTNKRVIRKSIVASRNISKGDSFNESNITVKRPGKGISPMKFFKLIGNKSKRKYYVDDLIFPDELSNK